MKEPMQFGASITPIEFIMLWIVVVAVLVFGFSLPHWAP
jgi:hypothetical protein